MNKKIELLSPAGDSTAFKAAVLAGADAIYFGLNKFSARTRATNITIEQLETLAPIAKTRGIKLYLALNTLLRDSEINDAIILTAQALERNVDAIIVQDIGLMATIRKTFPQAELHASTQMTTHNLAQLEILAKLGISQVNLARELSIEQIAFFSEKLKTYNIIPEVFVHGAYCISYSGQCYLSTVLYGKEGNRGSCVQPCRRQFCTQDGNYISPFSLKDNCAFKYAEELCKCAPISLKIEGRIKNAEYVWTVTKNWREQIDLINNLDKDSHCLNIEHSAQTANNTKNLKKSNLLDKVFNRGFATDYLDGCPTQDFFNNGQKDATIKNAGIVSMYSANKKILEIKDGEVKKNDCLLIKTINDKFICNAEVLSSLILKNSNITKAQIKITGKLNGKIEKGQIVYKSTPIFEAQNLLQKLDDLKPVDIPLSVKISGKEKQPLECIFSAKNISIKVSTTAILEKATKHGLNDETIKSKIGRLGGTGFVLDKIDTTFLDSELFIAPQELNELRRICVQKLKNELQIEPKAEPHRYKIDNVTQEITIAKQAENHFAPKLAFLCSSTKQAELILQENKTTILELPLFISEETQKFLEKNQIVIPHFQSILFEDDFKTAAFCLEKLSKQTSKKQKRLVWCENTGLADFARKAGFDIILGSFSNAANSKSILAYSKLLEITAIIPSSEISYEDINSLILPPNTKLYFPLFSEELLMQSRQCLLHNLSGCKKTLCDHICIKECQKELICKGKSGELLRAIKRKDFYSSLYRINPLSNAKAFNMLKTKIDTWIIDLRFQDETTSKTILKAAENFINQEKCISFVEPFKNTTEKQFWFC